MRTKKTPNWHPEITASSNRNSFHQRRQEELGTSLATDPLLSIPPWLLIPLEAQEQ